MKQLRLLRNSATFFHGSRVLPGLILFGMVLVTGCTSEAVAVAVSSPEEKPATLSSIASPDQRAVRYLLTTVPAEEAPSRPGGQFPFMLVGSPYKHARILDQNREIKRSALEGGQFSVSE